MMINDVDARGNHRRPGRRRDAIIFIHFLPHAQEWASPSAAAVAARVLSRQVHTIESFILVICLLWTVIVDLWQLLSVIAQ